MTLRRLMCVRITRPLIEQFLTLGSRIPGSLKVVEGLPEGARLVGVGEEPNRFTINRPVLPIKVVRLYFEHESFPPLLEGFEPPNLEIIFQRVIDPAELAPAESAS